MKLIYSSKIKMWLIPGVAGLGHYKNRAEKQRTAESGAGSSSAVLNTARLEGQAVCKTERLQTISTPLGPYDKNYSRKRLREHSLDRTDSELFRNDNRFIVWNIKLELRRKLSIVGLLSSSLPETFPGLEQPLSISGQHALVLVHSQPPHTPAVHVFRELHTAGPQQPKCPEHTSKEALDSQLALFCSSLTSLHFKLHGSWFYRLSLVFKRPNHKRHHWFYKCRNLA